MKNYRVQNSCVNCKFVLRTYEYDEADEFYCILDPKALPRPMCGSCAMEEVFYTVTDKSMLADSEDSYEQSEQEWLRAEQKWEDWSSKYHVSGQGICDAWEEKTK